MESSSRIPFSTRAKNITVNSIRGLNFDDISTDTLIKKIDANNAGNSNIKSSFTANGSVTQLLNGDPNGLITNIGGEIITSLIGADAKMELTVGEAGGKRSIILQENQPIVIEDDLSVMGTLNSNSLSVTNGIVAKDITATGLIQGLNLHASSGITGTTITASGAMNANSLSVTNGIIASDITGTGLIQGLNLFASANITATGSNSILSVASGNDTTHTLGMASIGDLGFNDDSIGIKHKDQPLAGYALLQGVLGDTYISAGIGKTTQFKTAISAGSASDWMVGSNAGVTITPDLIVNGTTATLNLFQTADLATNVMYLGHKDYLSTSSYFLAQSTAGNCFINSPLGKSIYFRINDVTIAYFYAVNNKLYANVVPFSDDRLKHNEKIITNAMETIRKLSPQTYDKSTTLHEIGNTFPEAGFIAQEVYEIPEIAQYVSVGVEADPETETEELAWGLDYNSIFTYAVAGLQELDAIVTTQATLIEKLEARLDALENK